MSTGQGVTKLGQMRLSGGTFRGPTVEQLARAAAYCHEDRERDEEIARRLGVTRRTLARWKHHPLWGPLWLAASEAYRLQFDRKREAKARGDA